MADYAYRMATAMMQSRDEDKYYASRRRILWPASGINFLYIIVADPDDGQFHKFPNFLRGIDGVAHFDHAFLDFDLHAKGYPRWADDLPRT